MATLGEFRRSFSVVLTIIFYNIFSLDAASVRSDAA